MLTRASKLVQGHWQLALILCAIFALWNTPVIQPLRIFIVYLHELSHALATLLTGGSVEDFSVLANESGHVLSRGGNRFLILTAGYLGSLLIGVFLFLAAIRTKWDTAILALLGALILTTTALYIRTLFPFAFGLITGASMIAIAWFLPATVSDLILRVIGLTSMAYVPYDIFSDTIKHAALRSDAHMLAQEFGGTTTLWGALWLAVALATIATTLRFGLGETSNITRKRAASKKTTL